MLLSRSPIAPAAFLLLLGWLPTRAETVLITADRDATLIEDSGGALANGSGPNFFVGRTAQAQGSVRRALVRFDVDSSVAPNAIIEEVALTLQMAPSNRAPLVIALHRVLEDWCEGPSASAGGLGMPSEPGDVTWIHTVYDDRFWARPGSLFVARSSARLEVGEAGPHTWSVPEPMLADVRAWLHAPWRNFGWVLIGDETMPQTAKSFASRESLDPALRPLLTVRYRLPGEP